MTSDLAAKEIVATALGLSVGEVDGETSLGTTPSWDSLAHFRLVLALEERLGRRLDAVDIVGITDLPGVAALLT